MKKQYIRCDICGRFISYKDLNNAAKITVNYTPSSYYSPEHITFTHNKCMFGDQMLTTKRS
jgi:hypothetical protein